MNECPSTLNSLRLHFFSVACLFQSDIEEEMIAMHEERARMDNARNTQAKRGRGRPKKGEFDASLFPSISDDLAIMIR